MRNAYEIIGLGQSGGRIITKQYMTTNQQVRLLQNNLFGKLAAKKIAKDDLGIISVPCVQEVVTPIYIVTHYIN